MAINSRIWWIDAGRIAGSPNPTESELASLREAGFTAIVCLLDLAMEQPLYKRAAVEALGYRWHGLPIRDFTAPSLDQFREFLRLVESEFARRKILLHCQGGSGRTGTLAAGYWIARGMAPQAALAHIRQANPGAVETPEQEASLDLWAAELARGMTDGERQDDRQSMSR